MSWLQSVLKWIQLKPRFLFGMAVCCFFLVSLPDVVTEWAGIQQVVDSVRGWLFIMGTVSAVFAFLQLVPPILMNVRAVRSQRAAARRLDTLSQEELELLAYCLTRNRQTLVLSLGSQAGNVASGLSQKGLMEVGTELQHVLAVPHTVPDFAWKRLKKRQHSIVEKARAGRDLKELGRVFQRLDYLVSGRDGSLPSTRW